MQRHGIISQKLNQCFARLPSASAIIILISKNLLNSYSSAMKFGVLLTVFQKSSTQKHNETKAIWMMGQTGPEFQTF